MKSAALLSLATAAIAQTTISTSKWQAILNADSGVLQSLKPVSDASFDFSPSDYFALRNGVGNYHTGDLTLRFRAAGNDDWQELDTAQRDERPKSSPNGSSLLRSDFDSVFPDAASTLSISRDWLVEEDDLILQATITSKNASVEIGAFGFPIEMNNIFTNRTADDTTAKCVLLDPYIGLDAGYVQATRLTGTGPNLVITPYGNHSKFEAWRFLHENPDQPTGYQTQVYEGNYAWQVLSKAYAEQEWNATDPWNEPTSVVLRAGQSVTYALRFGLSSTNHGIEDAVASKGVPVAIGVPGYVLPTDMSGRLFLNTKSGVKAISTRPEGALTLTETPATSSGWKAYNVNAVQGGFGRVRVTIEYDDGKVQTVHYYITDSQARSADKLGDFSFHEQWYTDPADPFHRAPSVISYDYETKKQVLQEERAWIAGISDEGGAGAFEAAAMKVAVRPTAEEVGKLEEMVNMTVFGWLQNKEDGKGDQAKYGVKRSLFFHDPEALPDFAYDLSIDFSTWAAWNRTEAYQIWRAYNYVHVSVLYWALYSAERASPGSLTIQNATWYLELAHQTVLASQAEIVEYASVGLMGETVWLFILEALQAEGFKTEAEAFEAAMKKRQDLWKTQSEPFGSEMAWDSTGQEGVYLWSKYFNDTATVEKTLNSIRGYMPTIAAWGWNGNARRYWDFLYAGKLQRIERMLHHYGSGLNSVPLLDSYKDNVDPSSASALHDLRVGYGGNMGALTNIHEDGFGAMAFHSYPDTMKWDGYSGDYGPNYLGHVAGACTFLVEHPDFGWISFGGNTEESNGVINVEPKDTVQRRIYVAPIGLKLEVDAGIISKFTYDTAAKRLTVELARADGQSATTAILTYKGTFGSAKLATEGLTQERGGYAVELPGTVEFLA